MGLLTVPKHYTPRKNGKKYPREDLIYASKAEQGLLRRMTDGKSDMTKHGIPSFYATGNSWGGMASAGSTSTNYNSSSTSSGARGTTGMQQGSNNYNSPSNAASRSGSSSASSGGGGNSSGMGNRGTTGMQQGSNNYNSSSNAANRSGNNNTNRNAASNNGGYNSNTAAGMNRYGGGGSSIADIAARNGMDVARAAAAARATLGISTPNASGSPYNNPAMINVQPGDGSLRNAMTQRQATVNPMAPQAMPDRQFNVGVMDTPRLSADPTNGLGRSAAPQQFTSNLGYQGDLNARAQAVSRGPGSVAGVMPGADALSQQRTLQTLAGSMNDDPRFGGRQFSAQDLQGLARTIPGEAGNESPMGQTAVANTMVNRMALAADDPKKYGYMGGTDIGKLMAQYDATGMRGNLKPNQGFRSAVPGTDALGSGIASLGGALASNSQFNAQAPAGIQNATHFYNPDISNPKWGGQGFTPLGNHTFGNAEQTAAQVASLRGTQGQPPSPTQVASIDPAVAPPPQQSYAQPIPQPMAPSGESWLGNLGAKIGSGLQTANATFTDANKKINQMGGGERVQALGKAAQAIMSFMPGGEGLKNNPVPAERIGAAGDIISNNSAGSRSGGGPRVGTPAPPPAPPPVTPPPPPPANWMYPQYTQAWAGLPTGIGGPVWRPKPPSAGLFDTSTDKKRGGPRERKA